MRPDESILPSSRKIKFIAAGIPCLLILYALSIGPLAKVDDLGWIGEPGNKILKVVYAPLALLQPVPGTSLLFKWYIFDVWQCDRSGDISS